MSGFPGLPERTWVDGVPRADASVLDRGLHYGDGLFETLAAPGGAVRFLALHLKRLTQGCERLGIAVPDPELLRRELATAAAGGDAIVKLIVTRGPARARGYAVSGDETPSRMLLRYPWAGEDREAMRAGVRVRIADLKLAENPMLAGIKHLNRLEQVLARLEWDDAQIAEALLFSGSGALVSGTMSNVFLVQGGRLRTPRLDRCGVAGVMREVVGSLAAGAGVDCERCALDLEDLNRAEELFLTSALTGIRPVVEVAGRRLAIGPVTRRLQAALAPQLRHGEGGLS
jgi:4-amino-4-deoxychorismate lyase